jgi:hypothetical protein
MALPDKNDVVIRQKHGNPSTVYVLGTPSSLRTSSPFARVMKPLPKPLPMRNGST